MSGAARCGRAGDRRSNKNKLIRCIPKPSLDFAARSEPHASHFRKKNSSHEDIELLHGALAAAALLIFSGMKAPAQNNRAVEKSSPEAHVVAERGAHHRIWQRERLVTLPDGRTVNRPTGFTELATGLHYFENGAWRESRAEFEITPTGAAATRGLHQAFLAGNINSPGAIEIHTADRRSRLKLARENIRQLDLQLVEDSFQLVQREMMFAAFQAVQRGVRETDAPREFCVRQIAPLFFQKGGELAFQLAAHAQNLPVDS